MKNLRAMAAILFLMISGNCLAAVPTLPWLPMSSTSYVLPPSANADVMLLVNNDSNTGQLIVSILNIDNAVSACSEGESADHGETSPFKINGRFIRMHQICINGSEIDQPTTSEGKQYLLNVASGNEPLSLEINSLHVYMYSPSNFDAVRKALSEAQNAL